MPTPTLTKRVETLEKTVNGPGGVLERLDALQADLTAFHGEFLQFRQETRDEFSAVRKEFTAFRREIRGMWDMTSGLRTHMQVLHEELLSRIALLAEGRSGRE